MKKVQGKSRRNTPAKRSRMSGAPKPAAGIGAAQLAASADPPLLALRLARLVFGQEQTGQRNGYHRLFYDVLAAQRFVFTRRFAALAEQTRTEDVGVTVTSLSKAKLLRGLTWWEWDPRITGRLPLQPGDMDCDRSGVLIRADESGLRGTMHVVASGRFDGNPEIGEAIIPLACHFDWRDDYETPASLLARVSVADAREALAGVCEPTLAEKEVSPAFFAELSNRFGLTVSPYNGADIARTLGVEWYRDQTILQAFVKDVIQDASFVLAAAIVLRTAPLVVTQVLRGARVPSVPGWGDRAPFDYIVTDVVAADSALAVMQGASP